MTFLHCSHRKDSGVFLVHPVPGYMGEGYTSPCRYNIANRVRPRGGWGQWGRIIYRGMARLHVQLRRLKMTMGVSMFHSTVHSLSHISQIIEVIILGWCDSYSRCNGYAVHVSRCI
jgi:hypothetical protein